jgi:hypothetical protein
MSPRQHKSWIVGLDCFKMFCTSYFFYRERPHCVSSTGQSFTPTPVDRKVSKILLRATSSKKIKVQKKRNSAAKQNKNNKGAVVKDTQ